MSAAEFKAKCEAEWSLTGAPMPESLDWKSIYDSKPFGRNLLKNPSPYGLSQATPPPEPELPEAPSYGPPRFEAEGDYTGWTTSREILPIDTSAFPPGVVVCHAPQYIWFSMEQVVDLKAEGLWDELLDEYQPELVIQDWYEETQLHESIYQLHVKLLGADKTTLIAEHTVNPTEDLSTYSHNWKEVSHVFSGYGPGVRYVHFLHRVKNKFMVELFPTLFTNSTVIVKAVKTSS